MRDCVNYYTSIEIFQVERNYQLYNIEVQKVKGHDRKEVIDYDLYFFELYDLYDVWGSKKDGYEVNNQRNDGVYLARINNPKQIAKFLRQEEKIKKGTKYTSIHVRQTGGDYIDIEENKTLKPIYNIVII